MKYHTCDKYPEEQCQACETPLTTEEMAREWWNSSARYEANDAIARQTAIDEAWDAGHICGREKSPTYKENKELRDLWESAEEDGVKLIEQARAEERKRCADIVREVTGPRLCPYGHEALRRIEEGKP